MAKMVSFFLFMILGMSVLSGILEGGGGVIATHLTAPMTAGSVVATVSSTNGYPDDTFDTSIRFIYIGGEIVHYTDITPTSFLIDERGAQNTTAVAHASGARVYTETANAMNMALGFDIATTVDSMGAWSTITIPFNFLYRTIPTIAIINYSFLTGDLALVGYIWFAMVAGFLVTFALYLAGGRRVA